jgi:hypothetical protein
MVAHSSERFTVTAEDGLMISQGIATCGLIAGFTWIATFEAADQAGPLFAFITRLVRSWPLL